MAHHIAVINVQAGVAHELVLADPAGAQQALDHVRRGASSVLDELSGILNVMRQPDDTTTSVDPLPTLDQLDTLIAELTSVGLAVEWHISGVRQRLAPAVGLAAYRIIQESLTNAHRHGHGPRAVLRVDHQPGTLSIEVLNALSADRPATGRRGHGTIGMRERVTAAGGSFQIGPTGDDQFRVRVTLPTLGDEQ
jgi:signal transduction histidine kinase